MATFVQSDGSLTQTGQSLYLHVNTVRKRMARVGSLLGIDTAAPEGYLVLKLAVHSLGGSISAQHGPAPLPR